MRLLPFISVKAEDRRNTCTSGTYDVRVTLENPVVAEFRAHSRVIGGALLPAATAGQG
jgi:hypothetical protein